MLRRAFNKLIQLVSGVIAIAALLITLNWSTLSQFKVGLDLRGHARSVRRSKLMLHDKERLLDVIEALEDRLGGGEQIGLVSWFHHAQTVQDMLNGGIEIDEVRLIERELKRSEKHFEEPGHD